MGRALDRPANESGVSASFWSYGLTSGCIIVEHLLVDDEDEGAEMRNTSEEAAGRSNITTGTRIIGLTAGCAVGVVCRENPGYFIHPPGFTFQHY